jgi:fluoride exporter
VALAAGTGAFARYLVDIAGARRSPAFPLGTVIVNVSGSLLLGLVTGLSIHHGLPRTPTVVLSAGFAGGYTTLSTWAVETVVLSRRARAAALLNVVASAVLGLAAAAAGLGLALL